jgi:hypothetical protein
MQPFTESPGALLSIGELSRLTGLHIETIRYYERVKMLPSPPRTVGGRRAYPQSYRRRLSSLSAAHGIWVSAWSKSAPCWIWMGRGAPHAPRCGRSRPGASQPCAKSSRTS